VESWLPNGFWATVCKTVCPMLSDRCLSVLSCLFVTFVHCGQTVGRIKMKLGMQVGLGPGHIVLDGDPAPLLPNGHSPQFSAHISCVQMAAWIKMSLGMELGLGPGDFVLEGGPRSPPQNGGRVLSICGLCLLWPNARLVQLVLGMVVGLSSGDLALDANLALFPKRGRSPPPQFSAHFYCGQTVGCMKMPLGTDVGLSPVDFVLDGNPVPSPKRRRSPQIFGPCLLWPNGWMNQDASWHKGRSQPRRLCIRWGPSPPPHNGGGANSPILAHFY